MTHQHNPSGGGGTNKMYSLKQTAISSTQVDNINISSGVSLPFLSKTRKSQQGHGQQLSTNGVPINRQQQQIEILSSEENVQQVSNNQHISTSKSTQKSSLIKQKYGGGGNAINGGEAHNNRNDKTKIVQQFINNTSGTFQEESMKHSNGFMYGSSNQNYNHNSGSETLSPLNARPKETRSDKHNISKIKAQMNHGNSTVVTTHDNGFKNYSSQNAQVNNGGIGNSSINSSNQMQSNTVGSNHRNSIKMQPINESGKSGAKGNNLHNSIQSSNNIQNSSNGFQMHSSSINQAHRKLSATKQKIPAHPSQGSKMSNVPVTGDSQLNMQSIISNYSSGKGNTSGIQGNNVSLNSRTISNSGVNQNELALQQVHQATLNSNSFHIQNGQPNTDYNSSNMPLLFDPASQQQVNTQPDLQLLQLPMQVQENDLNLIGQDQVSLQQNSVSAKKQTGNIIIKQNGVSQISSASRSKNGASQSSQKTNIQKAKGHHTNNHQGRHKSFDTNKQKGMQVQNQNMQVQDTTQNVLENEKRSLEHVLEKIQQFQQQQQQLQQQSMNSNNSKNYHATAVSQQNTSINQQPLGPSSHSQVNNPQVGTTFGKRNSSNITNKSMPQNNAQNFKKNQSQKRVLLGQLQGQNNLLDQIVIQKLMQMQKKQIQQTQNTLPSFNSNGQSTSGSKKQYTSHSLASKNQNQGTNSGSLYQQQLNPNKLSSNRNLSTISNSKGYHQGSGNKHISQFNVGKGHANKQQQLNSIANSQQQIIVVEENEETQMNTLSNQNKKDQNSIEIDDQGLDSQNEQNSSSEDERNQDLNERQSSFSQLHQQQLMDEYTDQTNPLPTSKSRMTSSKTKKSSQTNQNQSTLISQTSSHQSNLKQPVDSKSQLNQELRKKSIKKHIMQQIESNTQQHMQHQVLKQIPQQIHSMPIDTNLQYNNKALPVNNNQQQIPQANINFFDNSKNNIYIILNQIQFDNNNSKNDSSEQTSNKVNGESEQGKVQQKMLEGAEHLLDNQQLQMIQQQIINQQQQQQIQLVPQQQVQPVSKKKSVKKGQQQAQGNGPSTKQVYQQQLSHNTHQKAHFYGQNSLNQNKHSIQKLVPQNDASQIHQTSQGSLQQHNQQNSKQVQKTSLEVLQGNVSSKNKKTQQSMLNSNSKMQHNHHHQQLNPTDILNNPQHNQNILATVKLSQTTGSGQKQGRQTINQSQNKDQQSSSIAKLKKQKLNIEQSLINSQQHSVVNRKDTTEPKKLTQKEQYQKLMRHDILAIKDTSSSSQHQQPTANPFNLQNNNSHHINQRPTANITQNQNQTNIPSSSQGQNNSNLMGQNNQQSIPINRTHSKQQLLAMNKQQQQFSEFAAQGGNLLVENQNGSQGMQKQQSTSNSNILQTSDSVNGRSGTPSKRFQLQDFEVYNEIGRGSFGIVKLVKHTPTGKMYALKILGKSHIRDVQIRHIKNEKKILLQFKPQDFYVNCYETLQDEMNLYLVLEYLPGGELFRLIKQQMTLTEQETRFYLAEIVLAVERLHKKNILYRDLKPENILLDKDGHVKLIDFGFAKQLRDIQKDRAYTVCGTPGYTSPEVMLGQGYNYKADIWGIGILICEMIGGFIPFNGKVESSPKIIMEKIRTGNLNLPKNMNNLARDIVKTILEPDPHQRIEIEDIKGHKFFRGIDWKKVEQRQINPPFTPSSYLPSPLLSPKSIKQAFQPSMHQDDPGNSQSNLNIRPMHSTNSAQKESTKFDILKVKQQSEQPKDSQQNNPEQQENQKSTKTEITKPSQYSNKQSYQQLMKNSYMNLHTNFNNLQSNSGSSGIGAKMSGISPRKRSSPIKVLGDYHLTKINKAFANF